MKNVSKDVPVVSHCIVLTVPIKICFRNERVLVEKLRVRVVAGLQLMPTSGLIKSYTPFLDDLSRE